jgi:UTP--glucose-1-phosphate uridylyltransferase
MRQPVRTAVIAAAGHATRMWPASKAIPKELFPLGRLPALGHLLTELRDAGIQHVVLVVGRQTLPLFEMFIDPTILPPQNVAADPTVKLFQEVVAELKFTIIPQSGNYGNGTPLLLAGDAVGPEPCIYAFGDDIVLGENPSKGLNDIYVRTGCPVLATQRVESSRKSQFGIVECYKDEDVSYVSRLVEKPLPSETASDLASFGRYLVTPDLMDKLRTIVPGRNNEVWFVDAVVRHIEYGGRVGTSPLTTGKWYTVGDPVSFAAAVSAAITIT